jgi:sugar phosphate isomerase/epimerase
MQTQVPRRDFFKWSLGLGLAAMASPRGFAADAFARQGSSRFLLSLAAYSFRDYFIHASHARERKPPADKQLDLFGFLDYCADHGCHGAELTQYYFPPETDIPFLLKLKRHAFLRGLQISGTAVGNTFTFPPGQKRDEQRAYVKRWIDYSQILGAPHLRIFAGSTQGTSKAEATKLCIAALEEACAYAGTKGVMLGLENHGGIVAEADELLALIEAVNSPWLGINLDTGNFHTEDPYGDLAKCAPYAINVQLKVEIRKRGEEKKPSDIPRLLQILRDANYQGYVALEYEAAADPWKKIPEVLKELQTLL